MYSKREKIWESTGVTKNNKKKSVSKLEEDNNGNGDIVKLKGESNLKSDFDSSESQSSESSEQYNYRTVIQTDIEFNKKNEGDIGKIR